MKRLTSKKAWRLLPLLCLAFLLTVSPVFSSPAGAAKTQTASSGKWVVKKGKVRYRYANKTYAKKGFRKINQHWYYFDQNGYVKTGWFSVGKYRYYGNKSSTKGKTGRLYTGWHTIKGKTYYFSEKSGKGVRGRMLTGWQTVNKGTYYLDKNGVVCTGWKKIGGNYFYFNPSKQKGTKGKMVTGWRTIGKKKYYFRTTGKKGVKGARYKSEWVTIKGKQYYFNSNGSLNSGTMTEKQFIETIGKLASKDMKKSGILASVTTAQAILESGYGTSSLAMEAHNLFGMKATLSGNTWKSSWDGKTFKKSTKEYLNNKWYTITDTFRSYSSYAQSLADHSAYLSYAKNGNKLRYQGVVGNKSYRKTIKIIKNGGYATDPQYVSKICSIIKRYNLTRFDK